MITTPSYVSNLNGKHLGQFYCFFLLPKRLAKTNMWQPPWVGLNNTLNFRGRLHHGMAQHGTITLAYMVSSLLATWCQALWLHDCKHLGYMVWILHGVKPGGFMTASLLVTWCQALWLHGRTSLHKSWISHMAMFFCDIKLTDYMLCMSSSFLASW